MTKYVVYLLKSEKDGRYYIGYSSELERRLMEHERGKVRSTRSRRPLRLIGFRTFSVREAARYFEYSLKHHSEKKKKFIEEMLRPSGPVAIRASSPLDRR